MNPLMRIGFLYRFTKTYRREVYHLNNCLGKTIRKVYKEIRSSSSEEKSRKFASSKTFINQLCRARDEMTEDQAFGEIATAIVAV